MDNFNKKIEFKHGGDIYTEGLLKGVELIDFSSNINPLGVPKSFENNIYEALNKVTRYPDIQYRELIDNLIRYINRSFLDKNCFLLGNGAAEIIDCIISAFENILIVVPSFCEYEDNAKKWGCKIEYSYLTEHMDYNYEDILCKMQDMEALIIGNPNNPTGNVIDKAKFKNILDYCEKHHKTVIIDEAFIEFTDRDEISFISEIETYNCVFIIRALTKFFALPGIRFGYGISKNKRLIHDLKGKQNPWNINCFAETAVKYVLSDEEYIHKSQNWIGEEKEFMYESMQDISIIEEVYPTNCNYILCKLKNLTDDQLYKSCLKENIVIRKCSNFKGLNKRFVRFAIKDRNSNVKLLNVLKHIEIEEI